MAIKSTFRQTTPPFLQLGIPYSVAPLNSSRPPEYRDLDGPSKAPSVKCVRFAPMSSNIQPVAKPKRQPQSSVPSSDSMSAVVRKVELDDSKPLFVVRRLLSRGNFGTTKYRLLSTIGSFAIDDFNCYSFEARKLEEAKCVHKDHVYAVMEIDYSPTDRKFLTGSYDRTARSE